jgi:AraC family transcriptional regulator, positive regulator of tynA and feaB
MRRYSWSCDAAPLPTAETMMGQSDDILDTPQLDYEAWRDLLRAMCGRDNPEGIEPNAFTGWVRPVSVCGFTALDIGCNAHRIERTYRDVRLDGVDHYFAVFQVGGQSAMTHNDQSVRLAVGDVALVDAARPVTYFANNGSEPWNTVTLNLPRETLVSHLGFDPPGGICRRGETMAGRLLFDLIRNTDKAEGSAFSPADSYMQLAVYDLVGALFAPSDAWAVSRHADKLFTRIRAVIEDRFADPDFGPSEVAAEAGIRCVTSRSSLRSAARPAVNSSIRFVWITPRASCIAGRHWEQASLSARSPTPAASVTILISPENFAAGSVILRGGPPEI